MFHRLCAATIGCAIALAACGSEDVRPARADESPSPASARGGTRPDVLLITESRAGFHAKLTTEFTQWSERHPRGFPGF